MTSSFTLFPELEGELNDGAAAVSEGGPFAGVALEQSIDRVLDYSIPSRLVAHLQVGQRVRAPLGRKNRPARGMVVSIRETTTHPKTKPLSAIEDDRVLVSEKVLELARWISRYYVTPLGTVIESVVPAAVRKRTGLGYASWVRLAVDRERAQELLEKTKARKRRAILARLLQLEPDGAIEMVRLASEAGTTTATVRKLVGMGLITLRSEADFTRLGGERVLVQNSAALQADLPLNDEQRIVFDEIAPRIPEGGFGVHLLHGVTGSGKTEVYLQCIRRAVEQGRQAIVLVPEIALTPQTVRRFTDRFARVAVLHSGMSAGERHRHWQRIAQGYADVVVGARSAVFAPVPKLGIVVIDEEHDSSYKQDTAPRYHARDVAVKRAQIENVPIILGSATPSLESFHRATQKTGGSWNYHLLASRVRGLSLAHVELLNMGHEARMRRGIRLISQRLEHLLRHTLDTGKQAILLLNRRGYSSFVYCSSCTHVMQCRFCDTTMTYHRSAAAHATTGTSAEGAHKGQLHCHYCLAVNPLPPRCPVCDHKLSLFGLGTQRVEEELARKFPDVPFARIDSDSMRGTRDYERLLNQFGRGEIKVLLGTQMIAKGLDYPNVTLVGVISGDTALSLPDFRAAERTFQLITQVAGRAGRGDSPGRVVLQTFQPDDPTIRAAVRQDYDGFARTELAHRREIGLPPFTRMVRIVLRDEDPAKLGVICDALAAELAAAMEKVSVPISVRGPMPCAIKRIEGYFRNQIILTSVQPAALQRVLAAVREKGALARSKRIAVDVDPVSLL